MRRGGTVRGVFAGFLGLVALHALGTKGGSGRVKEAFGDVAGLIERVLDADVPAIPDRAKAKAQASFNEANPGFADAVASGGAQGRKPLPSERLPVPSVPTVPK